MWRFINLAEKWLKTDIHYLLRGGFWLSLSEIAGTLVGLVLAVAFANWLPKEVYGNYRYVLSLAGIISVFTLSGMSTAVISSVARGFTGTVKKAFYIKLKWGLFVLAMGIIGGAYYYLNGNYTLAVSLLIIGLFVPIIESAKLFGPLLVGLKNFKKSAFYSLWYRLFPAAFLLTVVFLTDSIVIIILTFFVSEAAIALWLYQRSLKLAKTNNNVDAKALRFGKQLSFLNSFADAAIYVDQIVVFHFLGAAQLAVYNFALIVPNKLRGVFQSLGKIALPKFSQRSSEEIRSALPRKLWFMGIGLAVSIGVYILVAPFIFAWFFPRYTEAVFYSRVAAFSILGGITPIVAAALFAHKKIKSLTTLNIIEPIIRLVLIAGFGYWLGLLGIVIARVLAQWTRMGLHVAALNFLKEEE